MHNIINNYYERNILIFQHSSIFLKMSTDHDYKYKHIKSTINNFLIIFCMTRCAIEQPAVIFVFTAVFCKSNNLWISCNGTLTPISAGATVCTWYQVFLYCIATRFQTTLIILQQYTEIQRSWLEFKLYTDTVHT